MSENHEKMLLRVVKQLTVLRENSCLIVFSSAASSGARSVDRSRVESKNLRDLIQGPNACECDEKICLGPKRKPDQAR